MFIEIELNGKTIFFFLQVFVEVVHHPYCM